MGVLSLVQTIILGVIQGIAEWLPISSTGHLRLAEYFFGLSVPILFDVTLHVGTLIVIFVFFRNDIKNILSSLVHLDFKTEYGRFIPLIIVGSIPTALIGLVFSDAVESLSHSILPIAIALVVSGTLLYFSKIGREKRDSINYQFALVFGVAQGIAIMPGISRSGTTIAVALLLGLKREKAFQFSFLLSIPAIIGALGLTLYKEHAVLASSGVGLAQLLVGVLVAIAVGYFALKLVHRIITEKKFYLFGFYCWILGAVLVALVLVGF